VEDMSR